MEVHSIFSDVCETMLWMHYFCVMFLFVSYKILIVGYFLVCLSIFLTLEACMHVCPLIVGPNISTRRLYIYDLLTMEAVDYILLISFTPGISISSLFLNLRILFLVDWILIIMLYVFIQTC